MVALIVEGTVRYDDIRRMSFMRVGITVTRRLLSLVGLLRTDHYQRQLTCRLPYFVLFHDLLGVYRQVFCPLVVTTLTLRTLSCVVDLVALIMGRNR